jgi:myo-inositol-1(or 4)-monophosphatase
VACGRLSAFFELDLHSWDLSAGSLIVSEAGGRAGELSGAEYTVLVRNIIASNGLVHDELLAALAAAGCSDVDLSQSGAEVYRTSS